MDVLIDTRAKEYADSITARYNDDTITISKEDFNSYLYWAFYNGMSTQHKIDINKIVFSNHEKV